MDLKTTFDFFNTLEKDNLSFLYQGNFSDELTDKIIAVSEINLEKAAEISNMKGKISFLLAECFQNIVRHGDALDNNSSFSAKSGVFITRNIGNIYYITSANNISNSNIKSLQEKLEAINELDKDGLKALYLELLNNSGFSEKGGAGIGLIEMARRSGQKLEYDFKSIDDKFSFFYLQIKLSGKSNPGSGEEIQNQIISVAKKIHEDMSLKNVLMVYKGEFSQNTVLPILKIIERNLMVNPFEHISTKRTLYHFLTEMLQNISKHSEPVNNRKEGIFLVGKDKKNYFICTGNYILNQHVEKLKEQIENLNNTDKIELNKLYIKKLREGKLTDDGCAGLGLIDIARESSDKLQYYFSKVDANLSFFTLYVKY